MQLLMRGNRQRTQEPTAANQTSSRSHAVLQVAVRQRSRVRDVLQEVRQGRLFMIDLAGSERASQVRPAPLGLGAELGGGEQGREAGPPRSPRGGVGTVSGRMGMGGCSGGEDTEGCHRKDGLGWGTPGRPPPRGCLWEGAWECESLSREGDRACPRGHGETARRMNGPGEELGPQGDDVRGGGPWTEPGRGPFPPHQGQKRAHHPLLNIHLPPTPTAICPALPPRPGPRPPLVGKFRSFVVA